MAGRVAAAIGGDMHVVVVVGGFVAEVGRPAGLAPGPGRSSAARSRGRFPTVWRWPSAYPAIWSPSSMPSGELRLGIITSIAKPIGMPPQRVLAIPADGGDLRKQQADGPGRPDGLDLQAVLGSGAGRQRKRETLSGGGRIGRQRLQFGGAGHPQRRRRRCRWCRRDGRRGLGKCHRARAGGVRGGLVAGARRFGALRVEHAGRNRDGRSERQPAAPPVRRPTAAHQQHINARSGVVCQFRTGFSGLPDQ